MGPRSRWSLLSLHVALAGPSLADHSPAGWSLAGGFEWGGQPLGMSFESDTGSTRSGELMPSFGFLGEGGWTSDAGWWGVDAGIAMRYPSVPLSRNRFEGHALEVGCLWRWEPFYRGAISPIFGIGGAVWSFETRETQLKRQEDPDPPAHGVIERDGWGFGGVGRYGLRIGKVELIGTTRVPVSMTIRASAYALEPGWKGRFERRGTGDANIGMQVRWRQNLTNLDDRPSRRERSDSLPTSSERTWTLGIVGTIAPWPWKDFDGLGTGETGLAGGARTTLSRAGRGTPDRGWEAAFTAVGRTAENDRLLWVGESRTWMLMFQAGPWWRIDWMDGVRPVLGVSTGPWRATMLARSLQGGDEEHLPEVEWWGIRTSGWARLEERHFYLQAGLDLDLLLHELSYAPRWLGDPSESSRFAIGGTIAAGYLGRF